MSDIRLPIRQLVEFLLRSGSIDSRFAGFDRALEGARIHRRLQKAAGEGYAAEVPLCADYTVDGIRFTLEGRADGIFTNETGVVTIDEIKTTAVPEEEICEDMNPCHWAQGMVYGAIYSAQESLPAVDVRLTYYQIDTDRMKALWAVPFTIPTFSVSIWVCSIREETTPKLLMAATRSLLMNSSVHPSKARMSSSLMI